MHRLWGIVEIHSTPLATSQQHYGGNDFLKWPAGRGVRLWLPIACHCSCWFPLLCIVASNSSHYFPLCMTFQLPCITPHCSPLLFYGVHQARPSHSFCSWAVMLFWFWWYIECFHYATFSFVMIIATPPTVIVILSFMMPLIHIGVFDSLMVSILHIHTVVMARPGRLA